MEGAGAVARLKKGKGPARKKGKKAPSASEEAIRTVFHSSRERGI
jgi:hypothetical protein